MSMLNVPAMAPGARSLPAELRTPRGNAWGWHRLHQNLAPATTQAGVSGIGANDAVIPVDPIPMPPQPAIPAYSGGGMPLYIQQLIASGAIVPQLPPRPVNAPTDSHLQHTPWGYIWAKVVKTQGGHPVITWMNHRPEVLMATNPDAVGVNGIGSCDPTTGLDDFTGAYCGGAITESQYPVVFSDGSTGTMGAADWANLISSSTNALTQILAVSQGGSVSGSGNIYGSPQTATVAAGFPQNQLSVSGQGLSGALSTPMILLAVGALVLITMSKGR